MTDASASQPLVVRRPPPRHDVMSVVIPALNAETTLADCLASIAADPLPDGITEREVILVDNGSTDRTADIAREAGVRVEHCATRGQGAARNLGFGVARGAIIAVTDSDCTVEPGWSAALLAPFAEDDRVGVVGGEIIAARQESLAEIHTARRGLLSQVDSLRGFPSFYPFVITACAAFRVAALDAVGDFDIRAHPAEDADLSWRMQWAGWRLAYAPDARVRHYHRATLLRYWRQIYGYGHATARLFAKHRHRLGRRAWLGLDYSGDIRRSLMRAPIKLVAGRNRYDRFEPLLDLTIQTASLAGRLIGSLPRGIIVL